MKIVTQVEPSLQELAQRLEGPRIAMLTLREADGQLISCPLTPQEMDAKGAIWFLVSHGSLTQTIRQGHDEVNVAFSDERRAAYVSISGRATVVYDLERKRSLWSLMAQPWFPGGAEDPSLLLLRVRPHRAELWDGPTSSTVRTLAIAAASAAVESTRLGAPAAFGTAPGMALGAS